MFRNIILPKTDGRKLTCGSALNEKSSSDKSEELKYINPENAGMYGFFLTYLPPIARS